MESQADGRARTLPAGVHGGNAGISGGRAHVARVSLAQTLLHDRHEAATAAANLRGPSRLSKPHTHNHNPNYPTSPSRPRTSARSSLHDDNSEEAAAAAAGVRDFVHGPHQVPYGVQIPGDGRRRRAKVSHRRTFRRGFAVCELPTQGREAVDPAAADQRLGIQEDSVPRLMEEVRPRVLLELGSFLGASATHMGGIAKE